MRETLRGHEPVLLLFRFVHCGERVERRELEEDGGKIRQTAAGKVATSHAGKEGRCIDTALRCRREGVVTVYAEGGQFEITQGTGEMRTYVNKIFYLN